MKTFYFLLRYSKYQMLLASVVVIITGLSMTALLYLINKFLADPAQSAVAWTFFGVCALIVVSRILSIYLVGRMTAQSLLELRMKLARSVLSVPLKRIEEIGGDRILPALTADIARINGTLGGFPFFLRNAIVLLCGLVYMAILSWQSFLPVVGFIALAVSGYYLLSKPAIAYHRRARGEWDTLFGHFRSLVHGIKEFKQHSKKQQEFVSTLVEPSERRFNRQHLIGVTIQSIAMSISQTMGFVAIGLLFFVLPLYVDISKEVLISYAFILIYMIGPVEAIIGWLPQLQTADVAMDAIEKLGLSLGPALESKSSDGEPWAARNWKSLELRGVTHNYFREKEGTHFTLGPIDLTLNRGELVFVVGGNGSGKTTLVKVLTGLYPPESGDIRLDGEIVTDENRDRYRDMFSVVFSDFYLLEHLLGLDDELGATAQRYLEVLQLNHKVQVKNKMFSTTELSQGQRKRLALLVAYLEDRPIYVFDEWAADQDPHFKNIFYTELLPELKSRGKTIVVVSHDDRYYHLADRLIKLEYGKAPVDVKSAEATRKTLSPTR
jgi:putative pyoverdin transport system ATP-binding/permease protein